MARRRRLTDEGVRALKPRHSRYSYPDPETLGLYIRVQPSGMKSYCAIARSPHGRQIWHTIGHCSQMPIEQARRQARDIIGRVKLGKAAVEPLPPPPQSFEAVAENWFKRHVEAKGLRSKHEVRRLLQNYVYPTWRARDYADIRRSDITVLLDAIEDKHGARTADHVLSTIRAIANWHATRHDGFVPPFVRGMGRVDAHKRARSRVLSDDEIRIVWQQAEQSGTFGAILQLLLLTGQRRAKVLAMRWQDISVDGIWSIPTEEREKTAGGVLVLPEMATEIIRAQPHISGNPYVFAGRGTGYFYGCSKCKRRLDKALPPMQPWTIHDLRRSARSLMSRANVPADIAERVLGHAVRGVRGIYDRHEYQTEKADALRKLAALIADILDPPSDKVVSLRGRS
jgi:integrase